MAKNDSKNLNSIFYVLGIFSILMLSVIFFTLLTDILVPNPRFGGTMDFRSALEFRESLELIKAIITTLNLVLLLYLLYNYVSIYREVKSSFSMGLIVIASALLAHTVSANPVIIFLFGFKGSGLGPFTIIPSFFTLVASLVLIYLSRQ